MQTIELVGFLMFTILVGGLVTSFIFQIDFSKFQDTISGFFLPTSDFKGVPEVNIYGFVGKLNTCWQQCNFGLVDSNCGVVVLKKSGLQNERLTMQNINRAITKLNYCSNCQIELSVEKDLPSVVSFNCNNGKLVIK